MIAQNALQVLLVEQGRVDPIRGTVNARPQQVCNHPGLLCTGCLEVPHELVTEGISRERKELSARTFLCMCEADTKHKAGIKCRNPT